MFNINMSWCQILFPFWDLSQIIPKFYPPHQIWNNVLSMQANWVSWVFSMLLNMSLERCWGCYRRRGQFVQTARSLRPLRPKLQSRTFNQGEGTTWLNCNHLTLNLKTGSLLEYVYQGMAKGMGREKKSGNLWSAVCGGSARVVKKPCWLFFQTPSLSQQLRRLDNSLSQLLTSFLGSSDHLVAGSSILSTWSEVAKNPSLSFNKKAGYPRKVAKTGSQSVVEG